MKISLDRRKLVMAQLSKTLVDELAIHHHNAILAAGMKDWNIPVQEVETYWQMVHAHNFTMLAITLCKFVEFHNEFRNDLPPHLQPVFDQFNSQLSSAGVQDFRNKFAGHIFDNKTGQPLSSEQLNAYVKQLIAGRTGDQFRDWWWCLRGKPLTDSVAGALIALRLHLADSMGEA